MDSTQFREFGRAAVDFIADYLENVRQYNVLPSVSPGFLVNELPKEIPAQGEQWQQVMTDIYDKIIPGLTHWQSPHMHGYFPSTVSYPSLVGDFISNAFGSVGLNWLAGPVTTELEVIVMDWVAKFLKLPDHFLHSSAKSGGGVIHGSATESILIAILTVRDIAVTSILKTNPNLEESEVRGRLVIYASQHANACIQRNAMFAAVRLHLLPTDIDYRLCGDVLRKAVEEDIRKRLFPIACIATLGTTEMCAVDNLEQIGPICRRFNMWLHVDAAYAGSILSLPEYAHLHRGLQYVESINVNLHKMLQIHFDCAGLWLRKARHTIDSFFVDRVYLEQANTQPTELPEFRHWQIALGRRFRAFKAWVTLRILGAEGLKSNVRNRIELAKRFEAHVRSENLFEIVGTPSLGLICFRIRGENSLTENLCKCLTNRKKVFLIKGMVNGTVLLRFVAGGFSPNQMDIDMSWNEIRCQAIEVVRKGKHSNIHKRYEGSNDSN